jgi:hypothetical protein
MTIDPKILAELVAKLAGCETRREASGLIDAHATMCGLSAAQVRRHCKAAGVDFGYARRSDCGGHRAADLEQAAESVIQIIVQSHGAMPTWRAIEVAKSQGMIPAALDLKPHFVDREIRDHDINRKPSSQPAVTRKIKWGLPGEVLQIDSTNCAQWFFVDDSGRVLATEPGTVYHNKPSKRTPIIRYVATDPSSGLFRVRYYQTDGESAQVTLDFLYWAMQRDEQPQFMPLAGVPKALVMDNGSGNRSAAMINVCNELGIDHRCHLPHHAWAKGGVEKSMDVWQHAFESELRAWPARDLDDMNDRATQSLYQFATTRIHTRHRMTRSAFYAKFVTPEGLVMPPPYERYLEAATTARVERTLGGDLLISYEGREYYAGELPGVSRGDKVYVAKCVLDWNEADCPVRIYAGDEVRVERALAKDGQGNYCDQRLYEKRSDAVLDARQELCAARLAAPMPQSPPQVVAAALPRVEVPKARLRIAPPQAQQPTRRRVQALMELSRQLGRELNEFEVNGLGWGDAVTLNQISNAVAALSIQRVLKVGPESTRAAVGG